MIVTVAFDITPPVWSVTVPRMRPKLPCENSGRENRNTPSVANSRDVILRVRPQTHARSSDGIELIVSPLREIEMGLWTRQPDGKQPTAPHPKYGAELYSVGVAKSRNKLQKRFDRTARWSAPVSGSWQHFIALDASKSACMIFPSALARDCCGCSPTTP